MTTYYTNRGINGGRLQIDELTYRQGFKVPTTLPERLAANLMGSKLPTELRRGVCHSLQICVQANLQGNARARVNLPTRTASGLRPDAYKRYPIKELSMQVSQLPPGPVKEQEIQVAFQANRDRVSREQERGTAQVVWSSKAEKTKSSVIEVNHQQYASNSSHLVNYIND